MDFGAQPQLKKKRNQDQSLLSGIPDITSDFRQMVTDTKRDAKTIKSDISIMRNELAPAGRFVRKKVKKGITNLRNRVTLHVIITKGGVTQRFSFSGLPDQAYDKAQRFALIAANNPDVTRVIGPTGEQIV